MRARLVGALVLPILGCTGWLSTPPDPNGPRPLPDLPATWGTTPAPFAAGLGEGPLTCSWGGDRWTWRGDGTFEVVNDQAKQGGSWQIRDDDLVHLTRRALRQGEECLNARILAPPGARHVLCRDRAMACEGPTGAPIEVLDAGGGADATALVGRALGNLDETALLVIDGGTTAATAEGVSVRYRPTGPGPALTQSLAERVARSLARDLDGPVPSVAEWADAPSPVTVLVAAPVEAAAP